MMVSVSVGHQVTMLDVILYCSPLKEQVTRKFLEWLEVIRKEDLMLFLDNRMDGLSITYGNLRQHKHLL